jgi:cleavage stimulation factor subunit 1
MGLQFEEEKKTDLTITTTNNNTKKSEEKKEKTKCNFITRFITTHKGSVRVAKFTPKGNYVATGSTDNSIKLLDVEKMHTHHQTKAEVEDYTAARPVVRTFYDHTGVR